METLHASNRRACLIARKFLPNRPAYIAGITYLIGGSSRTRPRSLPSHVLRGLRRRSKAGCPALWSYLRTATRRCSREGLVPHIRLVNLGNATGAFFTWRYAIHSD